MVNFFRNPFFLPWLYPQLTWRVPTKEKELFLSFDDGPVPGPTEFVLTELQKVNAKATFFCIGDNIRKHPDVYRKIIDAGHMTGNHTFHHLSGWKTSVSDYVHDVSLCREQMVAHHQQPAASEGVSRFFRPPYGRITRKQIKSLADYKIVMWDVLTHDYAKSIAPDHCLRGAITATRPGSIIVFHDSLKAERNMSYVLPRFLDHFAREGYSFKTLR